MKKVLALVCISFFISLSLFAQLKENFSESTITDEIYRPVGIRFDDTGRAFVWERTGIVYVIDSSGTLLPETLIDIHEEVGSWGDHGCLGFALDPAFLQNGYFYLFYVVDRHHLIYHGTSEYHPDSTITNQATIGRITRYQADPNTNFTTSIPESRTILIGETKETGIPILIASHGVGSLVFGTDGTLLASTGEAGSFLSTDVGSDPGTYFQQAMDDGILLPKQNVGSYRSQMIDAINGKILRIDSQTGDGIPSNPWYEDNSPRSARSRVYALGLRNPFRFVLKPNTGSHNPEDGQPGHLYIGDVGGSKWEELNICDQPGMNFGHPLYEGIFKKSSFWINTQPNPDAPNPLYETNDCDTEYFNYQSLIQQPLQNQSNQLLNPCDPDTEIDPSLTFVHEVPKLMYSNKLSNLPERAYVPVFDADGQIDSLNLNTPGSGLETASFSGYTSVPGLFYEGDNFPEEYRGRFFHADYSFWIRALDFDENNNLTFIEPFHDNSDYVLDLAVNPKDGCIYYVDFHSRIQRICYGGNNPPVASIKYDVQFGPSPLTVNFEGADSFDPEGTNLEYFWEFGDGVSSDLENPSHVFTSLDNSPLSFDVVLTVTDSLGAVDSKAVVISANNTPPEVAISSFNDGDFYSVNGYSILPLRATVTDQEHSEDQLTYSWTTLLKHNTHEHAEEPDNQITTQTIIEPIGCETETYWYEIQLEVTDDAGLIGRDTASLFPYCGDLFFILKRWEGKVVDKAIHLEWETEIESDLAYIEMQKISAENGVQTIGTILPNGAGTNYTFIDNEPIIGFNNYRLKVYRNDTVFDFSSEIRVLYPPKPAIIVYPNPAGEMITFQISEQLGDMELEIFDSAGALILKSNPDALVFDMEIAQLAAGVYTYRLRNGDRILTGKFVKVP